MKINLLSTEGTRFSASLKALAASLTARLGYKVWRTTKPKPKRLALCYGQSVNKIQQYAYFEQYGLSAVEYTVDDGVATSWYENGDTVFGRKLLNSSCGKGIVVFDPKVDDSVCPYGCLVYTKYKKKKREFRVHVFKDTVVAVTEKKRRKDFDGQRDTKIRNLANGYVFIQGVENVPEGLRELAILASKVSPSDFRGVDIGYNEKNDDLFVIEVNSAPGIQGSNINAYTNAIIQHVHN